MPLLDNIHGQGDLRLLDDAQRIALCDEIRAFLVDSVSRTGGHLASNLGVVELTVALETVYNTAVDRLVFDVGHQSYVHKLLTGRQADFSALRQFGGISGFPKPSESDTDAFVAGHASSSVSIALGMARARTLTGGDYQVVALLGDGAATGGLAYEGLNDAAVSKEPLVVVLNDNAMSIDRNVGGMASHLSKLRTKETYLGMKRRYRNILKSIPGGNTLYRLTSHAKDRLRRAILPSTIFEDIGMTYLGPVDGHDVNALVALLRTARDMKQPVLVHVLTHKGHGYEPAEKKPSEFHGVGKFDPETGRSGVSVRGFSDAFGSCLCRLAGRNDTVCAITAAMPAGTGLLGFKRDYPKRLFDVGIAEEHAVSMAGGMAKQGLIPVVALYSTFLQRAYDMILQDICMLGLHVVFAVDRAGLVGEDGQTHHGIYDVGFLRQAPGMRILCPASCKELEDMLTWAIEKCDGPVAIRYPRGGDGAYTGSAWNGSTNIVRHHSGDRVTLVSYGTMLNNTMAAAQQLQQQGICAGVLRILDVSRISARELAAYLPDSPLVFIVEETSAGSGIRGALTAELHTTVPGCRVYGADLGAGYITHGNKNTLYSHCGLDARSLCGRIMEVIGLES